MTIKDISSFLTLYDTQGNVIDQSGNVSFKYAIRKRTTNKWNQIASSDPVFAPQPWKQAYLVTDEDNGLGHTLMGYQSSQYPLDVVATINTTDWAHFRLTGTLGTITAGAVPRTIGGISSYAVMTGFTPDTFRGDNVISTIDLPLDYTTIGANIWYHPIYATASQITTAVGVAYVTYTNSTIWDEQYISPAALSVIRIEAGADAGFYQIQHHDFSANRLYLVAMDGRPFSGLANATVTASIGPGRRAWFNEAGVIQRSTGTITTGGRYNPRKTDSHLRASFIMRLVYDKSGSTEAAVASEKQGSYFMTTVPWDYGSGVLGAAYADNGDGRVCPITPSLRTIPFGWNFWDGGANAACLDWTNQRAWFGYTNVSGQSGIGMWKWKTCEEIREISNHLGTAAHASTLTPPVAVGTGDIMQSFQVGSTTGSTKDWVYGAISHATGGYSGIFIIKPDLTTLKYTYGSPTNALPDLPASTIGGTTIDRSRARTSSADVATSNTPGNGTLGSASGAFTDSDIGRVIKVTGGTNNNGTYLISARASSTEVTVTTLAGVAVSFSPSGSGGTFEIGDRLYIFYSNTATNLNKMTYMESMSPGTFLQKSVAFAGTAANGTYIHTRVAGGASLRYGQPECCDCDQATGNVYWLSNDGSGTGYGSSAAVQQVNKYNPVTGAHSRLLISDFAAPTGGSGSLGVITMLTAIKVNSKFDHIWVGSNMGHIRLLKSTFAGADAKRYYGVSNVPTYSNPAGLIRSVGTTDSTGMSFTNMVRSYIEHPDGRMRARCLNTDSQSDMTYYSQETDTWAPKTGASYNWYTGNVNEVYRDIMDPYGFSLSMIFNSSSTECFILGHVESDYQWDAGNSVWFPLEAARRGVPHKGSTATLADGATNTGFPTRFVGSGFVAADAGSYLQIITGGDKGVYRIGTYTSATEVQLLHLNGLPFASTGTVGSLQYYKTNSIMSKPIHSGFEELLWGVTVKFNPQGGATPANNEFLGLAGMDRASVTGASTDSGNTLTSSGFSYPGVADVGKLLKIENTTDAGLYRINTVTSANVVTLVRLDGSTPTFNTNAGVAYTVWDLGTPGSNAGPENLTFYVADGVAIDTNQDLTGMTFEHYMFKSAHYNDAEGRKFCVPNPIAVPGPLPTTSPDTKVYFENYALATRQWDPATSNHRALPGAEATNGRQLVDGFIDKYLNGTGQKATLVANSATYGNWFGNLAGSVLGFSAMVDFGKDVEVGFIQIRTGGPSTTTYSGLQYNITYNGLLANIYKANHAGGAPIASSVTRCTGASILTTTNSTTVTTSVTDSFLGSQTLATQTNGQITTLGNTFYDSNAVFVASDLGKVLKVTVLGDVGSFRIIAVSGDNKTLTIRNLDQTAKAWSTTASGITYGIWDAVREEDMLTFTSSGGNSNKLCVERLLTGSSAQVRTPPMENSTTVAWSCYKPTWDHVKRLSVNTEAVPPDVANNGTWITGFGRDLTEGGSTKWFFDFSDLTAAQRTGRFWKVAALPRFDANGTACGFSMSSWEFYDLTGKRIGVSKYDWTDPALQNADFFYSYVNRADFIQSANNACADIAGMNSTSVTISGASGDTLTLGSSNAFLGFQIGPSKSDGAVATAPGNVLTSASSSFPLGASVGRHVRITGSGSGNNGIFRVTNATATTLTLAKLAAGATPAFTTEGSLVFTVHEGFNIGGTYPDKFRFTSDKREYTLSAISDDAKTLTINETWQQARTDASWEIRRAAYDTSSATTEATKVARLVRPQSTYPIQSGDICHDSRGALRFFSEDVGTGFQRTDGETHVTGGFVGTGFTKDDIGRLLYILSGVDIGIYEIETCTSATAITVKNHYDGTAITFVSTAATGLTYQVIGDRRFTLAKYVTGLRA